MISTWSTQPWHSYSQIGHQIGIFRPAYTLSISFDNDLVFPDPYRPIMTYTEKAGSDRSQSDPSSTIEDDRTIQPIQPGVGCAPCGPALDLESAPQDPDGKGTAKGKAYYTSLSHDLAEVQQL
jgi:hypothetical protein